MIKLLLFVLLCFVFYAFLSSFIRSLQIKRPLDSNKTGETMVQDPECGTYLPIDESVKKTIRGQTYYFCSHECLKKFKDDDKP